MSLRVFLPPDVPCNHPGCLSHVTHPCEVCGRIAGRYPESEIERMNKQVADLQAEVARMRENENAFYARATKQVTDMQAENYRLLAQRDEARAEAEKYAWGFSERGTRIEELQAEVARLRETEATLRQVNARCHEALASMTEEAERLRDIIERSTAAAIAALEAVEWVEEWGSDPWCPWCEESKKNDHASDCQRQLALGIAAT